MRRRYKRRKFNKQTRNYLLAGIGIVITVIILVVSLSSIVIHDNSEECKKAGLNGGLFGCSADGRYSYNTIAMVIGNTANTPAPQLTSTAKKYLQNSLLNSDFELEAFSATSLKNSILRINNLEDDEEAISEKCKKELQDIKKFTCKLNEKLDKITINLQKPAITDGANYLETIIRAANSAKSKKDGKHKILIIVIGSGLSDNGILNFADNNLLSKELDEIKKILLTSRSLPEDGSLAGVTILWLGNGIVAPPQPNLTLPEMEKLKNIYTDILEELGAKIIFDDSVEATGSLNIKYNVKLIKTTEKNIWIGEKDFDESSAISFVGDDANFIDESAARNTLKTLAEQLKQNPNQSVIVEGYAANLCTISDANLINLTQRRADAVKQVIVNFGISPDRVRAEGKGHGGHDECQNGQVDENISKQNRIVKIKVIE